MTKLLPSKIQWVPTVGILIFVALYIYSASLYPGGSQADEASVGFSWLHNYWCNLMNEYSINGQVNQARPFAITAMVVLCLSLLFFFYLFAEHFIKSQWWKNLTKVCGALSMLSAILIFTKYHDVMTTVSSIFGIAVVISIVRTLYHSRTKWYKLSGAFCIILLSANNYIYYTEHFIEILPLLQKVTFALVLAWIVSLNYEIVRQGRL